MTICDGRTVKRLLATDDGRAQGRDARSPQAQYGFNLMATWKKFLEEAMSDRNETLADLIATTLTEADMAAEFDAGYGGEEGVPFTAWTENTVYFPCCYDGSEWVGSVSRHPDGKPTEHQGGG